MKTRRVKSRESNIYHRPECRYARLIKQSNRVTMSLNQMKEQGYHACRHCNNMSFLCKIEREELERNQRKMEFAYKNGILYVKTSVGCWKLVYARGSEQIALYHRNSSQVNFAHPERGGYHLQRDHPHFRNIRSVLDYVYEHDKFRAAEKEGNYKTMDEKYRRLARKCEKKAALKRVNQLFETIENENPEMKMISFC